MRLMVMDTRTGTQTWVHDAPAQLRGFAWSPDGQRLAYFAVEDGEYRLRIFDAAAGDGPRCSRSRRQGDRVVVAACVVAGWRPCAPWAAP